MYKILFSRIVILLFMISISFSVNANSVTTEAFSSEKFSALQTDGKPFLIHITASWCPTCAKQKAVLSKLNTKQDLTILQVDFDTQKDIVRQFNAQQQSTLVAYHGKEEKGRLVGETSTKSIEALIKKIL